MQTHQPPAGVFGAIRRRIAKAIAGRTWPRHPHHIIGRELGTQTIAATVHAKIETINDAKALVDNLGRVFMLSQLSAEPSPAGYFVGVALFEPCGEIIGTIQAEE